VAGSVALAHTRLAIIDLATGDQPLFAGAAALVGNGEVYNYRELRDEHPAPLRHPVRLRAAAASLSPRRPQLRGRAARHVRHRPA
jgi:asparagine synthetase B (glutamine-hydrolysing)